MRMNTLDNQSLNSRRDYSNQGILNQKLSFPSIFYSPNKSKLIKNKNRKVSSIHKIKIKPLELNPPLILRNHKKAKENIKMVTILNLEDKVNDIMNKDLELERQKDKIDKNKTINMIRLGLYKKKEENENDNNNEQNNFNNIVEKEKENEEDLEKMDNENREKEQKMEKKFKEKLTDLEKVKNECNIINQKIININDKIEDNQLDAKVLVDYAGEFDKKFEKKVSENINEKDNNVNLNTIYNDEFDSPKENEMNDTNKKKNKQFENLNKLIIYKQQREDKKKLLKESIVENENMKQELENELITKRDICNKAKKEVYVIRKKLIESYHLKLYEGLEFRNEGLSSIIKDIWNLGVNVNINFMPTYLDSLAIEFLFQKARHSIELSKIRKVIKDNENELVLYLKEWRLNNMEINDALNKINHFGFYDKNDEHKNTINSTNEKELFKTNITDISISYLNPYPKTKEFMIEYKKKHPQLFQRELPDVEIKHLKFKSMNIPSKIIEKNKKIEKMKYLLGMKIEQNKQNDRKEVERLNKEFIKNNYQEKYKVNVETLFGALFGDKKNEMLLYNSRLEKEFRDGKKVIQFHTKYNKLK